jgi:acyl-coenzyme A thioesterase PaaI-like protein
MLPRVLVSSRTAPRRLGLNSNSSRHTGRCVSGSSTNHISSSGSSSSNAVESATRPPSSCGGFPRPFFETMIESRSRLMKYMGVTVVDLTRGKLVCHMPLKPALAGVDHAAVKNLSTDNNTNSIDNNSVLHNGILSAMMDQVGGFGAWSLLESRAQFIATIDLRIDFISPVAIPTNPSHSSYVICEAESIADDEKFIRTDIVCYSADRSQKLAVGRGMYNVYLSPIRKKNNPIVRSYLALGRKYPALMHNIVGVAEYIAWLRLTYFPRPYSNTKTPKPRDLHIGHQLCLSLQSHGSAANDSASSAIVANASDIAKFSTDLMGHDNVMNNIFKMEIVSLKPGDITMRLPFADILLGNMFVPCLHGGVTATAVEYAGLACAKSVVYLPANSANSSNASVSTVNFCINYLKPAPCVDMLIDAVITNKGGSILSVAMVCWDKLRTVKIATGLGTYQVHKHKKD